MLKYIIRRLLLLIPVVVGATLLMFLIQAVVPADPVFAQLGPRATEEDVQRERERLGISGPLPVQYGKYLLNLLRGDMGVSIRTKRPVADDIANFFPATVELALATMVLVAITSVPLGILTALYRNTWADYIVRLMAVFGAMLPVFWTALVFQTVFYGHLGWVPAGQRIDPELGPPHFLTGLYTVDSLLRGDLGRFTNSLHHLVLPAATLALASAALFVRSVRSSLLETLVQDYIRTARAKGLRELVVLMRHGLPNAMIPVLTVFGLYTSFLLSRTVFVELIFSWPGLGWYALNATLALDFPVIMGVTTITVIVVVVVNLATDLAYAVVDPRVRLA